MKGSAAEARDRIVRASGRVGRGRVRRGRAVLAGLISLATVAAAGCSSTTSHSASAGGGSSGVSGLGSPSGNGGTRPEPDGMNRQSGVRGGALFGGDAPLVSVESKLGRKLAIVRVYYRLGQSFPNRRDRSLMEHGATLLVSLDLAGGANYASIIAGQQDATISAFLKRVEQAAVQYRLGAIYFCFEHEANSPAHHGGIGTPVQFVQAWDHIHRLAVAAHLDWNQGGRIHWVLILTHIAYTDPQSRPRWALAAGQASAYWPGRNEVDIVAADGYNAAGCTTGGGERSNIGLGGQVASPVSIFEPVITFAEAHGGLPVFIAEWGSVSYDSPEVQAGFIHQMQAFVAANHEIAAAMYWSGRRPGFGCGYSVDNHPDSLAALSAMGRAAALRGRIAPG